MLGEYGPVVLTGPVDFGTYVGLWLNLDRVRLQKAAAVFRGTSMALSHGPLPRELFEAVAILPEEVDDLEAVTNCERMLAEVMAKSGV